VTKLNHVIDTVIFYLAALSLGAVATICMAQVIARYAFHASFVWAEEVSIIILLWVTWIAACFAVKQRIHLRVTFLEEKLGPKKRIFIEILLNCLIIVFLAIVAVSGRLVIHSMVNITLLSLPAVPLSVMYASVPVGCILMIFYLIRTMAEDCKTLRNLLKQNR